MAMNNEEHKNYAKMNLADYYKSLRGEKPPKKSFVEMVASRCGVTEMTVRNWILYGTHPSQPEYENILSELTGIPVEDLWS
ncbi:MAG: hypothetical protein LUC22_02250 [Prevotella sp.]|nr:hypothetical protein [Prevotella sp.]